MFDIIGDVHGHYDEFVTLLKKMGYEKRNGSFRPPSGRSLILLGDYIDRGSQVRETVTEIRSMVEAGSAVALLGNHEYNAVAFAVSRGEGWLRSRSDAHIAQHIETLYQYRNHRDEWRGVLKWIRTLPVFFENNVIRAVHAAWIPTYIESLRRNPAPLRSDHFLSKSAVPGTREYQLIETSIKGVEISLPDGVVIHDKEGFERRRTRIRWWLTSDDRVENFRDLVMPPVNGVPTLPVPPHIRASVPGYDNLKLLFLGHYWLTGTPEPLSRRIACLDYSVARGGLLTAYRMESEYEIRNDHFVTVPAIN